MSNKDRSGESEALLNRTVDDDYVSELHKRNSAAQDHDPKQGRTLKIVLLCLLALMATGGLIAVIVTLVNRNHDWIETKQETNMFKMVGYNETLQTVTVQLESKYKKAQNVNDGDNTRCVDAFDSRICETEDNHFVDNIIAEISVLGPGVSRSVFRDKDDPKRWEVTKLKGFMGEKEPDKLTMLDGVGFSKTDDENFSFEFTDTISKSVLFDTSKRSLIYTDKYLEIGFTLPTQVLFGLGQHNAKFLLNEGNWTMFNRDQPGSPVAKGEGRQHLYGTHPFLMAKTTDNKFIGILFYNSNPQQVSIRFSSSGKSIINYKTIGGILDIYYIMADTADNVIMKYNNLVGKPVLPPFWALGFHQCSWQYNTTQDLEDVVSNYTSSGYIFDTIWSDIMYMDRYIDFTVDAENFTGIKEYIDNLHVNHRHFVPIVDAGISIEPPHVGTNWYALGDEMGVFMKTTQNPTLANGNLIGQVWPGYTAFVDFFHPDANTFWSRGLSELYDLLPFDGIWLDMNEPSNFCQVNGTSVGECYPEKEDTRYDYLRTNKKQVTESPVKPGAFDNIPFVPGEVDLITKTLSMDAYFHDENNEGTYVMYNIHNLYGTLETMATHAYLADKNSNRPLIISRDSFVGHGQYGSIWTGDNDASQEHMQLSINQIMNFNMFGMPFVGGDICGFGGDTTPELCARWAQVGAFYPFMRNHYAINKQRQEFYTFDEKFQKGMRYVLQQRYSLLRYMYTCLYQSSAYGEPTIRHPMYDHPEVDEMVHNENSFMIGSAVRISANFDISNPPKEFAAPFPQGRYLDYETYSTVTVTDRVKNVTLYNGWDRTNIHIKEGSIVPIQDVDDVTKSYDLLNEQMRLLIFPTKQGYAQGQLFIARGEKTDENFQFFSLIHTDKAIKVILKEGDITDKGVELNEVLEEVHIVGDESLLKVDFACYMDKDQQIKPLSVRTQTHKNGNATYLVIYGGDNTVEFDMMDTIFYGVNGVDYNYCDKGYVAYKKDISPTKHTYSLKKPADKARNDDLTLTLSLLGQNTVQVTITTGANRFVVPKQALNPNSFVFTQSPNADATLDDFVQVSDDTSKFSLKIHEFQNPDSVYFRINEDSLTFADYFLSLETDINTNGKLYGVGERVTDFFIKEGIYTTWALDQTDPIDDGVRPGKNIYGSHPVYFTQSKTGTKPHWGMFNLNANAQDTKISYSGDLGGHISHYISGQGIFDMYFFIENQTPEQVVVKYHNLIGNTLLPPFWGLGWQQCKYGYDSTQKLRDVYTKYKTHDFPLDVLWSDIDHMLRYRDFTYDKNGTYADLDTFIASTLHKENRRYVPIIDAGIAIVRDGSYKVFDEGLKKGVFIKSGNKLRTNGNDVVQGMEGVLYGRVWPGFAAFPDFTKQDTVNWWVDAMKDFHDQIQFDGIWLDMNEVSNFCVGACIPEDVVPSQDSVKSKLVYNPGFRDLEEKSLSIDGVHSDGIELNYHSLFGFLQGIATNKYFADQQKRPFIISRSTFAGQGKYTSHWNGDNFSEWVYLKASITGIYNMNLYGINFNGADICGFLGITTENMCQKWINVGAFYPFARSHDDIGSEGQEPYVWSEPVQATMRNALRWRYALLRYYYTQLYLNHIRGGMFWKPLFFEFPTEEAAYEDVERNVMIGPAIKFSPMLDEADDATQNFILPAGVWCNIIDYTCQNPSKISNVALPTTPDHLNLHLRMGHIIPLQRNAVNFKVNTTVDLNKMPMGLIANIDTATKKADGTFFADDGETLNASKNTIINMHLVYDGTSKVTITFDKLNASYQDAYTNLETIEIVGVTYNANLKDLLTMTVDGGEPITGTFDSGKNVLRFTIPKPVDMTKINTIEISK